MFPLFLEVKGLGTKPPSSISTWSPFFTIHSHSLNFNISSMPQVLFKVRGNYSVSNFFKVKMTSSLPLSRSCCFGYARTYSRFRARATIHPFSLCCKRNWRRRRDSNRGPPGRGAGINPRDHRVPLHLKFIVFIHTFQLSFIVQRVWQKFSAARPFVLHHFHFYNRAL